MPLILSGLAAREALKERLIEKVKALKGERGALALAIIQVGDRHDSAAYIAAKKRFGEKIGVEVRHIHLKEDISQEAIVAEVEKLDADKGIAGVIVQLPLPKDIAEQAVLDAIDPAKDADGIASENVKRWSAATVQGATLYPATARGIGELLDFYKIPLKDKRVCVIGRSPFVGTPVAALCRARGAHVTVCHSKTRDLMKETLAADVIVSAVGKPGLVTAAHVREGQAIVDVGLSRVDEKLVGDVDFERVSAVLGDKGAITPVPGGVGPMTVLALFENLIDCAILRT